MDHYPLPPRRRTNRSAKIAVAITLLIWTYIIVGGTVAAAHYHQGMTFNDAMHYAVRWPCIVLMEII